MTGTTTTPESRGTFAYLAYHRSKAKASGIVALGPDVPMWIELSDVERAAWINAGDVIWQLATTGKAEL